MPDQKHLEKCNQCDADLFGIFCGSCGHPQTLKRINGQYILAEVGSIFNFDKGILYTIRELLLRPGSNIQKFISEDRRRLVKPIVFIIVCSLIYTLVQQVFRFEDGYVNYSFEKASAINSIFIWVSSNYGYANILMAIFIAFWIKLFFRKYDYNFFEILILLCFVMGMGMLFFALFGIMEGFTNIKILDKAYLIAIFYVIWAIGQFFEKKSYMNYLKAFLSYFLGFLTFGFSMLLLGSLIDYMF